MERKSTLECYKEKEASMAHYMDVNARNYRRSESTAKCARCVIWGRTKHVTLECEKYEREMHEMMQVILSELGHDRDERM
ncbi:hypothetical protein E2C01_037957 [Portunus trituberculatus]|uniref:Uncharacterized protein n=1 Tax=Portunus trituberculatus TaxID=210409 RepID=A0A5B7FFZ7_PORTR|nr:hypothetical protein [Portunus trituberculatus]